MGLAIDGNKVNGLAIGGQAFYPLTTDQKNKLKNYDSLKSQNSSLQDENSNLSSQVSDLQNQNYSLNNDVSNLQGQVNSLQNFQNVAMGNNGSSGTAVLYSPDGRNAYSVTYHIGVGSDGSISIY